jgi:transposase
VNTLPDRGVAEVRSERSRGLRPALRAASPVTFLPASADGGLAEQGIAPAGSARALENVSDNLTVGGDDAFFSRRIVGVPNPSLTMHQIIELFRLHFTRRFSQRRIAGALGLSPGVVNKFLQAGVRSGLTWEEIERLTEAQLRARLFPRQEPPWSKRPPDFARIHQELKRKGVTRQLLWEEYRSDRPDSAYSYSRFCEHYQEWRRTLRRTLRQTHLAGEKLFVDFSGQTVPVIDPESGREWRAEIFVAVLGASNYTFARAAKSQTLRDWISLHVQAFEFFGGVPEIVVPDNLKSGVTKACRYEPLLNRSYEALLAHYETAAVPARPLRPRDKAKVESGVQVVQRWILARLRHRRFFSLDDLNAAIAGLLDDYNARPFKKLPGCRRSAFESLDLPALRALPAERYEFAEWAFPKVQPDSHIEVDGGFYSVPHQLCGQRLDVRLTDSVIEVFFNRARVALHPRGQGTTLSEHLPPGHRAHLEWSPEFAREQAAAIGPAVLGLLNAILAVSHPRRIRSAQGLLALARHFSPERLESACRYALAHHLHSRRAVLDILNRNLDRLTDPIPVAPLPPHVNVRGPEYYQSLFSEGDCNAQPAHD